MKFPKRKHPRLKEYDYSNDGGYFVTVCVKNKEKLLGEPVLVNGKIKLTPIGETAEKHIKAINSAYDGVRVDSYYDYAGSYSYAYNDQRRHEGMPPYGVKSINFMSAGGQHRPHAAADSILNTFLPAV